MTSSRGYCALALATAISGVAPAVFAERIVSIGGTVTETVYALGAGDRLVAVDSTSLYPAAADALPDVGYMRALSAEPIIALRPDVVLYEEDAGPPEVIEHLRAAQVKLVRIPDQPSVDGVIAKIRAVAQAVELPQKGEELIADLQSEVNAAAARLDGAASKPRVIFVMEFDAGSVVAAGHGTSADSIIALAGGRNVAGDFQGYKPISGEALLQAAPDYIITMDRSVASFKTPTDVLALPALKLTPAARDQHLVVMDGLLLLGFGPRLGTATRMLADAIHTGD